MNILTIIRNSLIKVTVTKIPPDGAPKFTDNSPINRGFRHFIRD